jgi:hypothetical protein
VRWISRQCLYDDEATRNLHSLHLSSLFSSRTLFQSSTHLFVLLLDVCANIRVYGRRLWLLHNAPQVILAGYHITRGKQPGTRRCHTHVTNVKFALSVSTADTCKCYKVLTSDYKHLSWSFQAFTCVIPSVHIIRNSREYASRSKRSIRAERNVLQ